jgi:hypothetical protein
MKFGTADKFRTNAVLLRHAATGIGLAGGCTIRKCRRDGGCTGPLMRYDAASAHFVPGGPGDEIDAIAPLCCFALDETGRDRIAFIVEDIMKWLERMPEARHKEATRAIAARDWSTFAIATPAEMPAEKPLSSHPLCAKGAPTDL